jgi:hypothetical protein
MCCAASVSATEVFQPRKVESDLWQSPQFRRAHPDLKHRLQGQAHLEDGRTKQAVTEFLQAARWGDKLSQAMLGELYWEGEGVKQDRARAYAWMDLAAERQFVAFVAKRERFWSELDANERERALAIGQELYASMGDELALARLDKHLRKERASTGSRLGYAGNGNVILPTAGGGSVDLYARSASGMLGMVGSSGGRQIPLTAYYARQYWQTEAYLDWQSDQLELARRGIVRVGVVEDSLPD